MIDDAVSTITLGIVSKGILMMLSLVILYKDVIVANTLICVQ